MKQCIATCEEGLRCHEFIFHALLNRTFVEFFLLLAYYLYPMKLRTVLRSRFYLLLFALALFTGQQAQAQCCTYTLSMHDSYGDGWNGGYLQVFVNNNLLGNFSAANFGTADTFQVCNGDSVRLSYTSGSYENENTYQLYDASWNLLFDDGPTPATGNVFSSVGNCNATGLLGNNPCNAIPIDTGQCLWNNNTNFLGSGLAPGCANYQGKDVWFKVIVPPSGNLSFMTDSGTINDTGLAVWSDSLCSNLQLLGCDDDAGNGYYSFLTLFEQTPGKTLYIQVFGYGTATGSFKLCVEDLGTVSLDSTELPLVIIHTQGQTIVPNTKVNCSMDIKYNGPGAITYLNGPSNVYSGSVGIEIRGATSSGYPQRPYGFETRTAAGANNNVSLLGMPAENDWVLLSNYNDRSLIRNTLAFKLFGLMGNYSPRASLCEVMVDSSYRGIYVLGEKIKRDSARVGIATLTPADTSGDELTGGYILQQNHWNASNSFQSNYSPIDHPGFDVHFLYEYPKPTDLHPKQKQYIASFIDSLETALYSANFADTQLGYRKYLDVNSFIDYFLINELARSNDGFKKSVFFHKDKNSKGGKLKAGPVWDFDWAWKTMATCSLFDQNDGSGWAHHINDCPTDNYSCGYYIRLLQDSTFANTLRCRYDNFRSTILDTNYLFAYIDSIENMVQKAQQRHFQRWPLLGMSGPAPEVNAIATTYAAELDTLKHWIAIRLQWLDTHIPGTCIQQPSGVSNQAASALFTYYPNPGNGLLHFDGELTSTSPMVMKILSITGQEIAEIPLENKRQRFTYDLPQKGIYFLRISDQNGPMYSGKVTVW